LDVGEEAINAGIDVATAVAGRLLKSAGIKRRDRITPSSGATVGQTVGHPLSIIAPPLDRCHVGPRPTPEDTRSVHPCPFRRIGYLTLVDR
jgi:hypothetical protein